ncbi:MAG: GldG family protein [Candidatus Doudnabacteria bacterium]|nr:GldG family protein [Candidatus Doudnabacteria bacterium]MCA9387556.1 GldG family protein [Candidatus Andersenbacteria bacterium]
MNESTNNKKADSVRELMKSSKRDVKKGTVAAGETLSARKATFASVFAVSIVALLGILVLINVLVYREGSDWRTDVTENRQYSLSGQTKQVLSSLDEDVRVLAFFSSQYPNVGQVVSLLEEYRSASDGKLTYELIDPRVTPALARQYQINREGTLLFIARDRQESVIGTTETDLTRGLIKITRDEQKNIVFVEGHGEKSPEAADQNGYALLGTLLAGEGYGVETVSLLAADIPENTDVLVIAGPTQRFAGDEVEKVRAYVEAGGRLFLMIDPLPETQIRFTEFDDLLAQYGVVHEEGVVVDRQQSLPQDVLSPVVLDWPQHLITESLGSIFLAGASRIDAAEEAADGFRVTPLALSSEGSWFETNLQEAVQDEEDRVGPISMAVAVEPVAATPDADISGQPRLVVLGDSDFAIDLFAQLNALNQDLFLNSVNWLADEQDLISIRPKDTQPRTVSLTETQQRWVGLTVWAIVPGLVILFGVGVFVRRRKQTA